MKEIEDFITHASVIRGIDPVISTRVARSEGGVDEYAKRGTFLTGSSWWPFQLHYGGPGYEYLGTVAGMGNGFTELTKWQPGDPRAWRDSIRYALNRVRLVGWTPFYGAAAVGIGKWDGINRDSFWDANAEVWDFETGAKKYVYHVNEAVHLQDKSYDCSQESLEWALWSIGRQPADDWLERTMVAEGVMSSGDGLLDASGKGLANFVVKWYGEDGIKANHEPTVSWDWVRLEGARNSDGSGHMYPILIGGRAWNHWAAVRDYDPTRLSLLLSNPSPSWMGVGHIMTQQQFQALGPFSAVRIWHEDLLGTVPDPNPIPPKSPVLAKVRSKLEEALVIIDGAE